MWLRIRAIRKDITGKYLTPLTPIFKMSSKPSYLTEGSIFIVQIWNLRGENAMLRKSDFQHSKINPKSSWSTI